MGFDQVSLFLYPPRWKQKSVPDPHATHYSGQPVRIISSIRDEESKDLPVSFDDVCNWFKDKELQIVERRDGFVLFHSVGTRPEIDVSVSAIGGEVTILYCRFRLNREAPKRLERWQAFIQELCEKYTLRISLSDSESVGPEEFINVVRRNDNWRCFAESFGWSEVSSG